MPERSIPVLFIDDDKLVLCGIQRKLGKQAREWETEYFTDSCEAMEALKEKSSAIVVSDWQMPKIDGIQLCKMARNEFSEEGHFLYFIVLTGKSRQDDIVYALESGADDYLVKPVDIRELVARIKIGIRIIATERKLYSANQHLQLLATTDPLTGLLNRRAGQEVMNKEFARFTRGKQELSLIMVDIDHFKYVNDTYGHSIGDEVLVEVANRLKSSFRNYDSIIRWGGEEFLVICPHTDSSEVLPAATRIFHKISGQPIKADKDLSLCITASMGTASTDHNTKNSIENLVKNADKALYLAKKVGRNCIQSWEESIKSQLMSAK